MCRRVCFIFVGSLGVPSLSRVRVRPGVHRGQYGYPERDGSGCNVTWSSAAPCFRYPSHLFGRGEGFVSSSHPEVLDRTVPLVHLVFDTLGKGWVKTSSFWVSFVFKKGFLSLTFFPKTFLCPFFQCKTVARSNLRLGFRSLSGVLEKTLCKIEKAK